ncbi:MAG: type II toxin-antitoxin system PemK/MazF family toxin [Brevinematales bacterium]|jgi:mRNA interferase MazF
MEDFIAGEVVIVRFPFSDLTSTKLRPALIIAGVDRKDYILCQITSKGYGDNRAISLKKGSFLEGQLPLDSYIRPGKIFTANSSIILKKTGKLERFYFQRVIESIISLIQGK